MWPPDSGLAAHAHPSPNHGPRAGLGNPDAVILHYTGMKDGASALTRLCSPASEVSSHYLVEEDGTVLQLVREERRAWHAGRSSWRGASDLNSASIGIEIVNGGHDFGLPDYPEVQIAAVAALCRDIAARRGIGADRFLAHSDVAPGRKRDPGEHFPWDRLHAGGIGLWVPEQDGQGASLRPGDASDDVTRLQTALAEIGYGLDPTGRYDDTTRVVVEAFQRRFRRSRIDGITDGVTRATLDALRREVSAVRSRYRADA